MVLKYDCIEMATFGDFHQEPLGYKIYCLSICLDLELTFLQHSFDLYIKIILVQSSLQGSTFQT